MKNPLTLCDYLEISSLLVDSRDDALKIANEYSPEGIYAKALTQKANRIDQLLSKIEEAKKSAPL